MPDDITIAPIGQPYPVVTDELPPGADGKPRHVQVLKTGFGSDGALSFVEDANPLPAITRLNTPVVSRLASSAINVATAGDTALLAGTAGQTIRVFRWWLVAAGDVDLKFKDGATDFHPAVSFAGGGSWVMDFDGEPWLVTSTGNGLILNLSKAVQVSGRFYYLKS